MSAGGDFHDDPRASDLAGDLRREAVRSKLFGARAAPRYLGRFVVHRKLGEGGLGSVYAAYDEQLEREVAIKVLHDRRVEGSASAARHDALLREARALARVSDPHVVGVYEVGEADGDLFLVMERVEGRTASEWIAEESPDLGDRLRFLLDLAEGLAAAHAQGVLHRDVKPANVLVDPSGAARLVDFGLARAGGDAAGEGRREGTPAYMAPEQWSGHVEAASDQFSFCVTMFEALYGERPFARPGEALDDGAALPSPNAEVPRGVHALVARGLSAAPDRRWASMSELVDALRAEVARYESTRSWRSRLALLVAAVLVSTLGAAALMAVGQHTLRNVELATLYAGLSVALIVTVVWRRRRLASHNMRLASSIVSVFALIALSRITAARYGLGPDVPFAFEFVMLSALATCFAVAGYAWAWWIGAAGYGMVAATLVWPDLGFALAIAWSTFAIGLMVRVGWRRGIGFVEPQPHAADGHRRSWRVQGRPKRAATSALSASEASPSRQSASSRSSRSVRS